MRHAARSKQYSNDLVARSIKDKALESDQTSNRKGVLTVAAAASTATSAAAAAAAVAITSHQLQQQQQ